ncbi:MFS transporter [Bacillus thuringiensis]|uniref:MFS transporter n=1 Tax=Bacillus thuringiensis TaxID=1428 RepID=UPI000BF41A0A|nr:MFS transporter [Bacillus thuringiensis]PEW37835.1 MFS transporter [Bacillus thuringiensis]PEY66275.1 MFS transporter [Bacillus thuringiensis]PFA08027.1 MFS transporter [Bacillus thuringiensis]PFK10530.1 MFS transporter [Bacillus thuringiensis]PFM26006.1 MFS transporter [Bacillus thuringiensis]
MKVFYWFSVFRGVAMGLFSPIWILYLIHQGYNLLEIGILGTIFEIAKFILEIPSGTFADKYGVKVSLVGSFLFSIITWSMFPFIDSWFVCIVIMLVWAISDALISGSFETWMSRVSGESNFGKEMMKNTQILIVSIIFSSVLSGYLYSLNKIFPFVLIALVYFILFIWMSFFVKVPPVNISSTDKVDDFSDILKNSLKIIFSKRKVMYIVIAGFFSALTYDTISRYWQPFLTDIGFDEKTLGYVMSFAALIAFLLLTITIKASSFIDKKPVVSLTLVEISGIVLIGLLSIGFKPLSLISTSLLLAIEDIRQPIVNSYLNKFFPDNYKATLFSINSGVGAAGEVLSGIIFGIIAVKFGLVITFLVTIVCLIPALIIYGIIPRLKEDPMYVKEEANIKKHSI